MIQAIRDDDPVIFFEHKVMYDDEEEVPDEPYTIPFGEANLTREGDDVTIVAIGRMVNFANQAADALEKRRHELHGGRPAHHLAARHRTRSSRRSRRPGGWWWSTRPIRAATWRPTLQHSPRRRPSARSRRRSRWSPRPIRPVPFAPELEDAYIPTVADITAAAKEVAALGPEP